MSVRITDELFFSELLDTTISGLEEIKDYAKNKDYAKCRQIFAKYVRQNLHPERFFQTLLQGEEVEVTEELLADAQMAIKHQMVSVGIRYDYQDKSVDWTFNPTANQYKEWTWQLNRHQEWLNLAKAYRATKDEKYADACSELFESWFEQAESPSETDLDDYIEDSITRIMWRPIECGIRQGTRWPEIIHSFYMVFSDDVLTDWCKSVWEHGDWLSKKYTARNLLLMEMNGLLHVSVLYPWFRKSAEWFELAMSKLKKELNGQIYPDGVHFELTTGYARVALLNFCKAVKICKVYDREVSEEFTDVLEKLLLFFVRMMRPDGKVPCINDGICLDTAEQVQEFHDFFKPNEVFDYFLGKTDKVPEETSYVFAYPGLAALRTGWSNQDSYVFFDGGELGAGHYHEDKLNVLFSFHGREILTEGNSYAYDTSEMRKYVRSTRAHNTIRVDGMDQNRKANYKWKGQINVKSHLKYHLTDGMDVLQAVYNEGYGEAVDCEVTHERTIMFVKKMEKLKPFLIIIDRLYAQKQHDYEVMWHLDVDDMRLEGLNVINDEVSVLVPECDKLKSGLVVHHGSQFPEWQGWCADSTIQDDYRAIYNLSYHITAKDARWVTVICPNENSIDHSNDQIVKLEAGTEINDTEISLILDNGKKLLLNELTL